MRTRNLGLVSFFVALFECGGGRQRRPIFFASPSPPPPPQSASGIWVGTVSQQGLENDTSCLVTETGNGAAK